MSGGRRAAAGRCGGTAASGVPSNTTERRGTGMSDIEAVTQCGWFFGSHGCDNTEGHAPLHTVDGGYVAHRCGTEELGWCSEIRPANEGETEWLLRQWFGGRWNEWVTYSAPFRVDTAAERSTAFEEWTNV